MTSRPKVLRNDGKKIGGKGFSREELKKAGLSLTEAVKLHIPVDPRRKTAHEENVETLKPVVEEKRAAVKSKKPMRKSKS
jgi:ribosomal protein L13E